MRTENPPSFAVLHALFLTRSKEAASMTSKFWVIVPGLLFLAGCTFPVRRQVDELICERGDLGYDLQPVKQEKAVKKENMQEGRNSPRSGDVKQAGLFYDAAQEPKKKPT